MLGCVAAKDHVLASGTGIGVYQVGLPLLCAGERLGPLGMRRPAQGRGRRGEQWLNKFVLEHHQAEAGRSPASGEAAPAPGRSGRNEYDGAAIAVIPADRGHPVRDVRSRT